MFICLVYNVYLEFPWLHVGFPTITFLQVDAHDHGDWSQDFRGHPAMIYVASDHVERGHVLSVRGGEPRW